MKIYSIRDSKGGVYNLPIFQRSHVDAERYLTNVVNEDPKNLPGWYGNVPKFPEDYDLFFLGEYDDQEGKMEILDTPLHITKAITLKK